VTAYSSRNVLKMSTIGRNAHALFRHLRKSLTGPGQCMVGLGEVPLKLKINTFIM